MCMHAIMHACMRTRGCTRTYGCTSMRAWAVRTRAHTCIAYMRARLFQLTHGKTQYDCICKQKATATRTFTRFFFLNMNETFSKFTHEHAIRALQVHTQWGTTKSFGSTRHLPSSKAATGGGCGGGASCLLLCVSGCRL